MTGYEILLLAVALAMDAAAVAGSQGIAARKLRVRDVVFMAVLFGFFQAMMPWLGWWLGEQLGPVVADWSPWIAFVLLVGIGGKMLWETRQTAKKDDRAKGTPLAIRTLLWLALATSIDAFAVGVMLPILGAPLVETLVTIGVVTAVLSATSAVVGNRLGRVVGARMEWLGGIILILLGIKILATHLLSIG
jgi:putative Mn2+ efflux pump MntP